MKSMFSRVAQYTLALVVLTMPLFSVPAYSLSRGHTLLLKRGLQTQALVLPYQMNNQFNLARWAESGFACANTNWGSYPQLLGPAPGIQWAKVVDYNTDVSSAELPFEPSLVSVQVNDEQDFRDPDTLTLTKSALLRWRTQHPGVISYTNQPNSWPSGARLSTNDMANYMLAAQPDLICMDDYQFAGQNWQTDDGTGSGLRAFWYYHLVEMFREMSLKGNDGTGQTPIPWGMFIQTFNFASRPGFNHVVSESELRFQYFSLWTMGAKFLIAFIYNAGTDPGILPILFTGYDDSNPTPVFYFAKECNRQSANIGPSLIMLLNTDVYMKCGSYWNGSRSVKSGLPDNIPAYSSGNVPYLTNVTATNLGTGNNALPGDVVIGKFKVLDESFDGPNYSNETYFMVQNGLCIPTGSAADAQQKITLNFNFGTSGINTLQRVNRNTGKVEDIPLVWQSDGTYRLDLILDGGTADLFKFKDGAPFVYQPGKPIVDDSPGYSTDIHSLSAHWPELPNITQYQYAVGTTPGATDVIGWTSNGTSTSVNLSCLSLAAGTTYYISVKAGNSVGLWSDIATGQGIAVINKSFADVFSAANYKNVSINGAIVTAGTDQLANNTFFVESFDRTMGIKVSGSASIACHAGDLVTVQGSTRTKNGSRWIYASSLTKMSGQSFSVSPFGMNNRAIGGKYPSSAVTGQLSSSSAYNIGLLVKTTGLVKKIDTANSVFYIDDGSNRQDQPSQTGICVSYGSFASGNPAITPPNEGDFVSVTGPVSTSIIGGVNVPIIQLRCASDITSY